MKDQWREFRDFDGFDGFRWFWNGCETCLIRQEMMELIELFCPDFEIWLRRYEIETPFDVGKF